MKSSPKRGNLTQTRNFIRSVGTEQSNIFIHQPKKKLDGMGIFLHLKNFLPDENSEDGTQYSVLSEFLRIQKER